MIIIPAIMTDKEAANAVKFIFKSDDYQFAEAVVHGDSEDYRRWQRQNLEYDD